MGDQRLNPVIQWGPGLGDDIARAKPASFSRRATTRRRKPILHKDGNVERVAPATAGAQEGAFLYAGIDDHYFVVDAVERSEHAARSASTTRPSSRRRQTTRASSARYVTYAVRFQAPQDQSRFFFGPKAFDELRAIDPERRA